MAILADSLLVAQSLNLIRFNLALFASITNGLKTVLRLSLDRRTTLQTVRQPITCSSYLELTNVIVMLTKHTLLRLWREYQAALVRYYSRLNMKMKMVMMTSINVFVLSLSLKPIRWFIGMLTPVGTTRQMLSM